MEARNSVRFKEEVIIITNWKVEEPGFKLEESGDRLTLYWIDEDESINLLFMMAYSNDISNSETVNVSHFNGVEYKYVESNEDHFKIITNETHFRRIHQGIPSTRSLSALEDTADNLGFFHLMEYLN